jgi:hypothetical protein
MGVPRSNTWDVSHHLCKKYWLTNGLPTMHSIDLGTYFCRNLGVATLLWKSERMILAFSKWGLGSSLRLPNLQSSISGVKTPLIEALFKSLESYQSLDIKNGLA